MGFELVLVRLHGGSRTRLQVMAEPADRGRGMTVDDCADISHAVSAVLDVADPIAGTYTLEVSSPGIDRPLVRPEHFERFAGERAKLETELPVDGRRKFQGRLDGLDDGGAVVRLVLEGGGEPVRLPLAGLKRAKLAAADGLRPGPAAAPTAGAKRKGKVKDGA